jgi:peptide/nickel transport system substrate-binding protein
LCFNLNDSARQRVWSRLAFRRAVAAAIDRDAMVRLIYLGFGEALASPVAAGNRNWIDAGLPRAGCSASKAREILAADGFKWSAGGALLDVSGNPVRISIIASSTNPDRLQMATLIQSDLKLVGIAVDIVPLEQRSLVDRVVRTHEYDAAILALASQDADPKADMTFWCSSGGQHVWNPEQKTPSTPWEAEIDRVMQKQLTSVRYADRKRLFDRAQELVSENVPVIPLVTPHVLVGAKRELGNFQPALLEPYAIWNIEELYWQTSAPGRRQ